MAKKQKQQVRTAQPRTEQSETITTQEKQPTMSDIPKPAAEPTTLSQEDLIQLQLRYKDLQLATLQHKVSTQELEKAVEQARSELMTLNDAMNQKYKLDPTKDKISIQDGTIIRG